MRRMYSEQELTKVIGDVVDSKIEDGSFDESIADYIDEYLVEHPIDITALNGKDVACKSVTTTNNVSVGGALSVTGDIAGDDITGNSIIENMSGYSYEDISAPATMIVTKYYAGVVKNGNKLTFAISLRVTKLETQGSFKIARFTMPRAVADKLVPTQVGGYNYLAFMKLSAIDDNFDYKDVSVNVVKNSNISLEFALSANNLVTNVGAFLRIELTFLLSDNLLPQE